MFLLLILLVSPAFGRPSSGELDVEAEVTNHLDIFANFHHETGKLFLNSSVIETIVKMLLEAEKNILEMHAKLKRKYSLWVIIFQNSTRFFGVGHNN